MTIKSLDDLRNEILGSELGQNREDTIKTINKEIEESDVVIKKKNVDRWKTIGSWAFLILAISIAIFVYLCYTGEINLVDLGLLQIPATNVNCPEVACPTCPKCSDCIVTCPDIEDLNCNCDCGGGE